LCVCKKQTPTQNKSKTKTGDKEPFSLFHISISSSLIFSQRLFRKEYLGKFFYQLGPKDGLRKTNGEAFHFVPVPCLEHHEKSGAGVPGPCAAIDSAKAEDI
jgi:hypothetical protein